MSHGEYVFLDLFFYALIHILGRVKIHLLPVKNIFVK